MAYQLPSIEQKAQYVQHNFSAIASKYDVFNDLVTFGLHRYWKGFLINQLGLSNNAHCLDLCCGSGDIAKELAKATPEGQVHAIDFSYEMLSVAQEKFKEDSLNINTLQGDATRIPMPDASCDAITIGYGLRNVNDLQGCLNEMLRVLKPGGVLGILDVGKVWPNWIAKLHHLYFFYVVPRIGKWLMPEQEMFDYLPHSSINYPSQEALKRTLLRTGYQQVDVHNFLFGASTIHIAYKP